jgi:5-methyltetrahydropteroyltriglutamate--homocysteine methyltransferase
VKACVGAGPVQLAMGLTYRDGPVRDWRAMARALVPIFRAEIDELVEAGCRDVQLEDLGAWVPNLTGEKDFDLVIEVVNDVLRGLRARGVRTSWHFCFGNTWGNRNHGLTKGGYGAVLPRYLQVDVDELVLDFACREMDDAALLTTLPADKRIAAGVIDVRSLEIEQDEQVAARIRKLVEHVDPARITLTTDCGMKQLPRYCAVGKLRALVRGAAIVRKELGG